MKLSAPFLFLRDFFGDMISRPKNIHSFVSRYQNLRSYSYPIGVLPLRDIFDVVPDAATRPVTFQGIFEIPALSRNLPHEAERYTASTTLADSYVLALISSAFVKKQVLEVGTSYGESALLFALNSPDEASIVTLDIQTDNPTVGMRFRGTAASKKIKPVCSTLTDLLPTLEPKSFDLIFIDGDHSHAGVMADTMAAIQLVRPGGVICWHDYSFMFRDDVVRALDEVHSMGILNIQKIAYTNVSVAVLPD
ncbi:MAG: O-methyltransferase [Chthoniobacterales bacterium]